MDKIISIEQESEHIYRPMFAKSLRLKGSCLYLLQKLQDAEKCLEKFVSVEDISVFYETVMHFAGKTEFEKALVQIEKIIGLDPDNTKAWDDRVSLLIKLGRADEAMKCQEKYEGLQALNPRYWYQRGIGLSVHGLHEKALPFLDKAIKLDPQFSSAWYSKAGCLAAMGHHKKAIRCYNKALKLSADSFIIWYEKGLSHIEIGQYKAASKCFDKVLAIEPGHKLAERRKEQLNRFVRR
jgi:tetratricopeptide (TPR) repeat protein